MKRYLFILILSILFFINGTQQSLASTLYTNDFKTSYTDFWTFFGSCYSTSNGLSCGNGAQGVYQTELNNLVCVYGDFTVTPGDPQLHTHQLMLWEATNSNNLGKGAIFYIPVNGNFRLGNYPLNDIDSGIHAPTSGTHTYGLCKKGDMYTTYMDGKEIQSQTFTGRNPNQIGFQLQNNATLTNFYATATLPAQQELNIPLLKQTAEPWQDDEYDGASVWNPSDPRIYSWGCAMTSAAMVFNYHGIRKLPDGTVLDPGTLNAWLKAQPDGYVGSGNTNWLALQRLSKQAKSINNITTFDALQYKRTGFNTAQLTADIKNSIPGILQVPGHFIVAKGITEDSFSINDPFYNRLTLKDGYANTFSALGRYVPSFTDLSYIMVAANQKVDIYVVDENGNEVGEQFTDSGIVNPGSNEETSGSTKMFYFAEPSSGEYTVKISTASVEASNSTIYLYDREGEVSVHPINTFGGAQFTVKFDKENSNASTVKSIVTFESTIQDILQAEQNHSISKGLAVSLRAIVYAAEKHFDYQKDITRRILEGGLHILNGGHKIPHLIAEETYSVLTYDFNHLLEGTK